MQVQLEGLEHEDEFQNGLARIKQKVLRIGQLKKEHVTTICFLFIALVNVFSLIVSTVYTQLFFLFCERACKCARRKIALYVSIAFGDPEFL